MALTLYHIISLFPKSLSVALLLWIPFCTLSANVQFGIDRIDEPGFRSLFAGKKIGLLTHAAAIDEQMELSADIFLKKHSLTALFAPEHGLSGAHHANREISNGKWKGVPLYTLLGTHRKMDGKVLATLDLLVIDLQDIGSRTYSYVNTALMAIESAAAVSLPVVILDRPNPIGGGVDGPMLGKMRSSVGYANMPLCHGMTIGELGLWYNKQERISCTLSVVPMSGWNRQMMFENTGRNWVPPSPYIPDPRSSFYYAATGLIGELRLVNIGIGYTAPFRMIGAPWIDEKRFAEALNAQKLPGVYFHPLRYTPFYGRFAKQECGGVLMYLNDLPRFQPVKTQFMIIGLLKSLYPKQFAKAIASLSDRKDFLAKATGQSEFTSLLKEEKWLAWKLIALDQKERETFLIKRAPFLLY